ncbi:nephrin-like [Macrobrachium nipponense]|uniref:nephrin-like n=1 Tax=Macrobrachium nipponense TaxID=159736 RepID=UPI0030C7F8B0
MAVFLKWRIFFELLLSYLLLTSAESSDEGEPDDQAQQFAVVPESVEVNAGDDVFLKCVVLNQQGKTQWTKDGFALGFERDVPGYPRYSYSGDPAKGEHHLVINGTTLEDDGEYQCQVGPTATTSALWAAANVTVMVPPSSISVTGDQGGKKVAGITGQTLQLECIVKDGRPAPSVAWYRNGFMLDQDLHAERLETSPKGRRWSVVSHLVITPEADDDGQQFSCRALHPSLMNSPTSLVASVVLSILHPPKPPAISGYFTGDVLKAGELVTLTCESPGGNPTPELTWYKDGQLLDPQNFTSGDEERSNKDGKLSLVFRVKPEDDKAVFECQAVNEMVDEPLSANVTFTVHYSPKRVVVKGPSVVAAGQTFTLTCLTSRANPSASINWLVHGVEVATVSSLRANAAAYNSASDEVARETRLISVIRPPGRPSLQVEGVGDVVAGGQLVVKCSSAGGNPHPGVTIYKGHEKLLTEVTVDGRVTRARAVTEVTASDNGAKVSCHVTNPATDIPSWPILPSSCSSPVPPWEVKAWVSPTNVSAGQVAKLICESSSSLPASSITWRSGSVTNYGATSMNRPGLYGGQVTRSVLEVRALIEDNQRTYICDATNGLGVTVTTNVTLNVLHEPVWKDVPSGVVEVREKDDLLLKAVADANPPPVTYNGGGEGPVLIQEGPGGGWGPVGDEEGTPPGGRGHDDDSSSSPASHKTDRRASWRRRGHGIDEDGSTVITCSAIGNPTPNITWFTQDNDSSIREVLSWGVSEARLLIDFVTRADTGFYKCLASNVVETARPIKTAVVVTQAPEPLEEVASREDAPSRPWAKVGGTGRLECFVKAAPAPNFRWTINEDRVLFKQSEILRQGTTYSWNIKSFQSSGMSHLCTSSQSPGMLTLFKLLECHICLMDGLAEWSSVLEIRSVTSRDYTTYTCTASNYKGAYTSNHTLGPPIPPHQPYNISVASVIGSTAILTWIPPSHGTTPSGYTIRYRPLHDEEYLRQKCRRARNDNCQNPRTVSRSHVRVCSPRLTNSQGTSDFTSPSTKVAIPGVVEEVASSSSQPRVPRLTLLLMSLTGAALLVLNISIIICFIRRFALSRNTPASSYKTAISETYTPASTPAMITDDDEEEKTGGPEIVTSTSQYQLTRQSSIRKEDRGSPGITKIIHHYNTDIVETSKPQDGLQPTILIPSPSSSPSTVPQPEQKCLNERGLNLRSHGPSNPKTEPAKYNDFVTDDGRHLDDNIAKRTKADAQDIPDVCPKSSGSGGSSSFRQRARKVLARRMTRVSLCVTP